MVPVTELPVYNSLDLQDVYKSDTLCWKLEQLTDEFVLLGGPRRQLTSCTSERASPATRPAVTAVIQR